MALAKVDDLTMWACHPDGDVLKSVLVLAKHFYDARSRASRMLGVEPNKVKMTEVEKQAWSIVLET